MTGRPWILVAVAAALVLSAGLALRLWAGDDAAPTFAPQAAPPPTTPWEGGPQYLETVDSDWVQRAAAATGIPSTAMLAYAQAAVATGNVFPECGIGWNTIAAIGLVESDHGRHGGAVVAESGRADPPIFGVALDGDGVALIPDTDDGAFDGDAEHDRAVGPMQIIPQTWRSWAVDASGDNLADPHNIKDAAFAAANHLCRSSGWDMVSQDGWRAGIAGYNAGEQYLRDVASAAQRYLAAVD
jgi:membrane-bound lytic murein transglycosylase B